MNLVLLGAPGSGKGTQGERLSMRYSLPRLSTGDILRAAIKRGTPIGKKAEGYMAKGELVPDDVIVDLMAARMKEVDCGNGYILDGFPRTIGQAKGLEKFLDGSGAGLDAVVNITVSEEGVIKRLGGRRVCSGCGALYHLEFSPPKASGKCDKCGAGLYQRDDDKEETIKNRLKVYKRETAPLIDYYKKALKNVDGEGSPEEIFDRICSLIR